MNQTPARLLRRECLTSHLRPPPSERTLKQRAYILDAAMRMFATYGRDGMTLRNMADALDLSRDTLRRHICDLHHLFALVLAAHITALTDAITALDTGQPNLTARRRAEYHRLTTSPYGYTARLQILLDRERSLLPEDELGPIEAQLAHLASLLGATPAEAQATLFTQPQSQATETETSAEPHPIQAWPPQTLAKPPQPVPRHRSHALATRAA